MYDNKVEREKESDEREREEDDRGKRLREGGRRKKKNVGRNDNGVIDNAEDFNRHIHKPRIPAVNHRVAGVPNGAGERLMETFLSVDIERDADPAKRAGDNDEMQNRCGHANSVAYAVPS